MFKSNYIFVLFLVLGLLLTIGIAALTVQFTFIVLRAFVGGL